MVLVVEIKMVKVRVINREGGVVITEVMVERKIMVM